MLETAEPVEVLWTLLALVSLSVNIYGLYQAIESAEDLRASGLNGVRRLMAVMRLLNASTCVVAAVVGLLAGYASLRTPYPAMLAPDQLALRPPYQWGWVVLQALLIGGGVLGEINRRRIFRMLEDGKDVAREEGRAAEHDRNDIANADAEKRRQGRPW